MSKIAIAVVLFCVLQAGCNEAPTSHDEETEQPTDSDVPDSGSTDSDSLPETTLVATGIDTIEGITLTASGTEALVTLKWYDSVTVAAFDLFASKSAKVRTFAPDDYRGSAWSRSTLTHPVGENRRVTQVSGNPGSPGIGAPPETNVFWLIDWSAGSEEAAETSFTFGELTNQAPDTSAVQGAGAFDAEGRMVMSHLASGNLWGSAEDGSKFCLEHTTVFTVNRLGLDGAVERILDASYPAAEFPDCLVYPSSQTWLDDDMVTHLAWMSGRAFMAKALLDGTLLMLPTRIIEMPGPDDGVAWVRDFSEDRVVRTDEGYVFVHYEALYEGDPMNAGPLPGERCLSRWWVAAVDFEGTPTLQPTLVRENELSLNQVDMKGMSQESGLAVVGDKLVWCNCDQSSRAVVLDVLELDGRPTGELRTLFEFDDETSYAACDTVAVDEHTALTAIHVRRFEAPNELWAAYTRF